MPEVSVVIPAYREEARIGGTLTAVSSFFESQGVDYELIIVDDGSPDATADVVERFRQEHNPNIRLLRHPQNRGKGAAVRTGMMAAAGGQILFADADNSTPIGELLKLQNALQGGADVAMGSRYLSGSNVVLKQPLGRRAMSRAGNLLFRIVLGLPFADTRCGFKLFNSDARDKVFPLQTLERWGFDTEILVIARRQGLKVAEVPVEWYDKPNSTIHPWRDSLRTLSETWQIWKNRWGNKYEVRRKPRGAGSGFPGE